MYGVLEKKMETMKSKVSERFADDITYYIYNIIFLSFFLFLSQLEKY